MKLIRPLLAAMLAVGVLVAGFGASPAQAQAQGGACGREYTVERGDTLGEIAMMCEVSYSDLLEANPDIDNPSVIYPGQIITMPGQGTSRPDPSIPVTGGSLYIVRPGDTLEKIAGRFVVSEESLRGANPWLENFERVFPGMRLTLPRGAAQVRTLSVTPTVGHRDTTVTLAATGFDAGIPVLFGFGRSGGPMYRIGQDTTDANGAVVREFNIPDWVNAPAGDYIFVVQHQNNPDIRAGSNFFNLQRPAADRPGIPVTGGPTVRTYTVKSGDTLFEIAQTYQTTLDALLDLNPEIEDAEAVYPGQTIVLPRGTRPAGPYVTVSDPKAWRGGEVTVKAYNFPANAYVDIRLVPVGGTYVQPYDARTNARGNLTETIRVPWTADNGRYRIVVFTTERREITRAESEVFEIATQADWR